MLVRDIVEGPKHELVEAQERAQRGDVPVEDLEDAGVAALLAQPVMEREIGPRYRRRVAGSDGGVDLVDQLAKRASAAVSRPRASRRAARPSSAARSP